MLNPIILRRMALATCAAAWLVASACASASQMATYTHAGRAAMVYTPDNLPTWGSRALVVVLHGGMGNAQRIAAGRSESALNLNAVADQGGFVVAYLNGTPVARFLGADKLGWNAGACCGQPAERAVDDVGYIRAAVEEIAAKQGIDRSRIFGVGHSNGAMMTQRVLCETALYAAAVPIAGGLESGATHCAGAPGRRIMAIHGADEDCALLRLVGALALASVATDVTRTRDISLAHTGTTA